MAKGKSKNKELVTTAEVTAEENIVMEEAAPKKRGRKPSVKKAETESAENTEAAPKKTTARKTTKKAAKAEATVKIQYAGKEIVAKEILEAATKAFQEANEGVAIETIELYIKPEEDVAYYAVNGIGNDDYKVEL